MKNRQVNTNKCKELIVGTLYNVDRDIVLINYNQKKKNKEISTIYSPK